MTKGALAATAILFGLGLRLSAQECERCQQIPALTQPTALELQPARSRPNEHLFGLAFAESRPFLFRNSLGWTEVTPVFLPAFASNEPFRPRPATAIGPEPSSKVVTDVKPDPFYAHGEVGFLYGRSSGRRGGEIKQGYVIGEVGNDKVQITAGASYEESSARHSRFRSY